MPFNASCWRTFLARSLSLSFSLFLSLSLSLSPFSSLFHLSRLFLPLFLFLAFCAIVRPPAKWKVSAMYATTSVRNGEVVLMHTATRRCVDDMGGAPGQYPVVWCVVAWRGVACCVVVMPDQHLHGVDTTLCGSVIA